MIDAGIHADDVVVVEKRTSANVGDIVVAIVDNEFTLKRRDRERGRVACLRADTHRQMLRPENKSYPVIRERRACDFRGGGRAVSPVCVRLACAQRASRRTGRWVERYGIPKALYTDKKNVFIIRARPSRYEFITDRPATLEEQLAGEEPRTAFGKACAKLDITIIPANSPQANQSETLSL